MKNDFTVSVAQAQEIFKAINGVGALLKRLPCKPEDSAVKYAIMSNINLIHVNLIGTPRASSH